MPANGRQHGRCPADAQGKMLAPRNGGIRLCRQWGANSVGDRPSLRVKCWRPATEIQGFAGNGAPTWAMPGRFSGQNVGAPQRRHKALPAPRRQLGRCPGHLFLFFRPGVGARIPADPCSFVPFAPSLRTFSALGRHGLGAQIPAKPCSFVPFAPSLRTFSALGPARTWCTSPRKTLFFRFLCTKSSSLFSARPARTWCTNPRKTLFFRSLCTKSPGLFSDRPARTWCTDPRKTLFFRPLCTKSPDLFGARPAMGRQLGRLPTTGRHSVESFRPAP